MVSQPAPQRAEREQVVIYGGAIIDVFEGQRGLVAGAVIVGHQLVGGPDVLDRADVPEMDGFEVINVSDIIRAEANDNYTNFYLTNGKTFLVSKTLKHFDDLLCDFDFIRTHKSHLVNLQYITKYIKGKGGQVRMSDDSYVDVSATRKKELLERFR